MSDPETLTSPPAAVPFSSSKSGETNPLELCFADAESFIPRHLGPDLQQISEMASELGQNSIDQFIDRVVPEPIRLRKPLQLPKGESESKVLNHLRNIALQNKIFRSFLGLGYYDCITPPVIQRNILENPGWYTQYTPYQAEISQGRLEALLTFQTMVIDLTAMEIANASMLDEASAAAEAMTMSFGIKGNENKNHFFISAECHPQSIQVVQTRAQPLGIVVHTGDHRQFQPDPSFFGALIQYPSTLGTIYDYGSFIERLHAQESLITVATDLLALCLLVPPGEFGADIVVGNSQRFGVPLGYGGPHAAFFATREAFKRQMPGRLVGVSKDAQGRPALRLSLQTREQHIRREKATSNICTAQALLANIAAMYAVYHGPERLRAIAQRIHSHTVQLAVGLENQGVSILANEFFDTLAVRGTKGAIQGVLERAGAAEINLREIDPETLGVSLDETTTEEDIDRLLALFRIGQNPEKTSRHNIENDRFRLSRQRKGGFLTHPVFNRYHSETEMLRYLRRLESRDLSLTTSMIPLGSCTMKLNATAEMFPVTWPEFSRLHPFAPLSQTGGYQALFQQLEGWLAEITGFDAVSLQPNAGSQGEYAGLLAIRRFHEKGNEAGRNICLIPTSAHGTNPASAVMAGLKVVAVACDSEGNVDLDDLQQKAKNHQNDLAALMVTYPSTHGVFEEKIKDICDIIHAHGGQVYMDGANMNAQVGLCRPGDLGADVCHLNLHKTFCIPHGGGGPGMGPIAVAKHLAPFLPGHPVILMPGRGREGAIAAAPWGSASILTISWVYISLMGGEGLAAATKVAILNANYMAQRLDPFYPVLFKGKNGCVAHECIIDLRRFKAFGVEVEDVAKRLMDYGFHAPTISFPVPGTMMIEPTESESKRELDRFCEAMIAIHKEITAIEKGEMDRQNNPLKNAPHTAEAVTNDQWQRPYSRQTAAFPSDFTREHKFWPPVGRIDNVYGDRNLICSCAGMEMFVDER